ncbi:MAG: MFS transporter [Bryobacterales bacterium]|nr:MFS transporter [Bryobacterales bacterium]
MPHRRWFFIGLAFLATVINYLDRQTLSVAAPVLREQLRFGDIEYSWIVNGFLLAYTVMNGVSGPLIDRLGTRRGYALCMLWWSAAGVLHGFASSPWGLGVCRFLLGMGEAGNWPAAIKVVSEWFPPRERPLASGIFNSGSAIGALVAPPLIAYLLIHYGWQSAFWMVGGTGFVWLAIWWFTYETPPRIREQDAPAPPARSLLKERFVWSLLLAKTFFDPVWYFYIFWFPQYLSSAHGFTIGQIGAVAWIPFATADIGNIAGGALAGFLDRRGWPAPAVRRTVFAIFPLCMTAAIPAVLMTNAAAAVALVSLATFGYTGCLANMLALPGEGYPRSALGSIWGLASMGSGFGGMLFTFLTGRIVASYSYVPVFIGFGLMPLITAAILRWVACPAIERRANEHAHERA